MPTVERFPSNHVSSTERSVVRYLGDAQKGYVSPKPNFDSCANLCGSTANLVDESAHMRGPAVARHVATKYGLSDGMQTQFGVRPNGPVVGPGFKRLVLNFLIKMLKMLWTPILCVDRLLQIEKLSWSIRMSRCL